MEELLKQFMGHMDKRFDELETRFDKRFEEMDIRFKEMDKRFDQMDKRFEEMDKRFEQMDKRFDKVETDISELKEEVRNNQVENRSHFKFIESKLDEHSRTFLVVSDEIKSVKIDIAYLNAKTGEHDSKLNNLIQRFHS